MYITFSTIQLQQNSRVHFKGQQTENLMLDLMSSTTHLSSVSWCSLNWWFNCRSHEVLQGKNSRFFCTWLCWCSLKATVRMRQDCFHNFYFHVLFWDEAKHGLFYHICSIWHQKYTRNLDDTHSDYIWLKFSSIILTKLNVQQFQVQETSAL